MKRMTVAGEPLVDDYENQPSTKYFVGDLKSRSRLKSTGKFIVDCAIFVLVVIAFAMSMAAYTKSSADTSDVVELQKKVQDLTQELEKIKWTTLELSSNLTGVTIINYLINNQRKGLRDELVALMTTFDMGWFTPFNGYKYQTTLQKQTWNKSRLECKSKGAELAYIGVKDYDIRSTIMTALSLGEAWIGLHDQDAEGSWIWVDGANATEEDIYWKRGEPNSYQGRNEDCAVIGRKQDNYRTKDVLCDSLSIGLCEKKFD